MSVTKPTSKTWLSAYQPVNFGVTAENGFPFAYSGVTNVNGKAQFTSSGANTYGTAPGKYFFDDAGDYAGIHTIVSVDSSGNILTNTDYTSNETGTGTICVNYLYRIYYGYPSQDDYIEVRPVWVNGSLVCDIQQFLQSFFTIQPPTLGYDDNMYTHILIRIIAAEDYAEFLSDNSLDEDTTIASNTTYDWEDAANLWYVINGVYPHTTINTDYSSGENLTEVAPITFTGESIIASKIDNDRIKNVVITV